jgi:DNA-directed RNA polymerase II subunit RPB7
MYFKMLLKKVITVLPHQLESTVNRALEGYLRHAVEGKILPRVGLVVAVIDIENPHTFEGKILDNGSVQFLLIYTALVYKLFRNEIIDVIVTSVTPSGFRGDTGAQSIQVARSCIPEDYIYESDGAADVFVMKDGSKAIRVNDVVRVRIISETPKNREVAAIASITGDYLGPR